MTKVEDKVICKYCGKEFSKAGIANHEKACAMNPDNMEAETQEVKEQETENTTEAPVAEVAEVSANTVDVCLKENLECYIGDRYYRFKKGEVQSVPVAVKDIIKNSGLLEAL
jgi:hypothetical protein